MSQHTQGRRLALITLILLCGFALRIYRIDVQPYSGDEAFTIINWSRQPISLLLTQIALIDPQPPGTLLSIYGWTHLVGEGELATRLLPALISTVTLATVYAITNQLFSHRTSLTALLLLIIHPYHIWHAQDLRSYSLWMGLSSLSLLFLIKSVKQTTSTRWWLAYILLQTASLYTFYLEAFVLAACHVFMLSEIRRKSQLLKPWLISQTSIALLIAPWFLQPALRASGYSPTAGSVNLPQALSVLIYGETIPQALNQTIFKLTSNTFSPAAFFAIILIGCGTILLLQVDNKIARSLLLTTAFVPTTLLILLTLITQRGYFRARYVSASLIPLTIIIAHLITQTKNYTLIRSPLHASLAGFTILIYAIPAFSSIWTYHFVQQKSPPWHETAAFLQEATTPSDIIIRNYPDPAFEFYVNPPGKVTILPDEPDTPQQEIEQQVNQLLTAYETLFFIPVPSPAYDPEQIVAQTLDNEAQLLSRHWFGPTQILAYADWQVKPEEIPNVLNTQFGNIATLTGYQIYPEVSNWQREIELTLTLYWEPHQQTDNALIIRTHLVGPLTNNEETIWRRDDGPPLNGNLATLDWPLNQLIRDVRELELPSDAPPGEYTIAVSLHNLQTGENIPTQSGKEQINLVTFNLPLSNPTP